MDIIGSQSFNMTTLTSDYLFILKFKSRTGRNSISNKSGVIAADKVRIKSI